MRNSIHVLCTNVTGNEGGHVKDTNGIFIAKMTSMKVKSYN